MEYFHVPASLAPVYLTVWTNAGEVLARKPALPPYAAVIGCEPADRVEVGTNMCRRGLAGQSLGRLQILGRFPSPVMRDVYRKAWSIIP